MTNMHRSRSMPLPFPELIARFGSAAKAKLSNPGATGEPEDQLRAPLEELLSGMAQLAGFNPEDVVPVGESSLADLKTRPDYAVTVANALVGFIEVKAPGKGGDPRRFRDKHDKEQWMRLKSLPNLLYTDGNEFSLWRSGELSGSVVRLTGDVEASGSLLAWPPSLIILFEDFLRWTPTPPRTAKQLAEMTARLCRLLRDEVTEQLRLGSTSLNKLAADWRHLLFPDASDAQFADGYAQAVTFGMLMARAREIPLADGLDHAAKELGKTNSLIGGALRLLTDEAESQTALKTSLGTLVRVLDAVHWAQISRGDPDKWLYFYEDFLEVYDRALRKQTGSYYTPPPVVNAMVRLVDDVLRTNRFALSAGISAAEVTVADPAVGTGTFMLGALRQVADRVAMDQGSGAVAAAIDSSISRMIAFEIQLGPFAVAQLRVLAELTDIVGRPPTEPLRMFVADTLSNPYEEQEWIPGMLASIAQSRREANKIKRTEPITVVIGNPPYKEKAKGRGGWVESGSENSPIEAPLDAWMPPREWGVGAHAKHLRNLYVYFWRWATWKVFDHDPNANHGIVCFISASGFLNGPGFEKMRDYLRRKADDIWVIDCSPEGHQPDVSTRIFEGVQQPICIVLASRSPHVDESAPATVRFRSLPEGHRNVKFEALGAISVESEWTECSSEWRAPFLPKAVGAWATYPALEDLFIYNGSGVMPGRTWVIAPDAASLRRRWDALIHAPAAEKEELFQPHMRSGKVGDRHINKILRSGLAGHPYREAKIATDTQAAVPPVRYGFRSFDRQWIIPDARVLNQPNPTLWEIHSGSQLYVTALARTSPSNGPALTLTSLIPDLDHYKGSFGGRVFPLWHDADATVPNVRGAVVEHLTAALGIPISAEDVFAYIAAVAANPAFTERFQSDLAQPGLRIPIAADAALFAEAVSLGKRVIWLHTYGERFVDPADGRPAGPPRLPTEIRPTIPAEGAIPQTSEDFPDTMTYDPATGRLGVGSGYVEHVTPAIWAYEVSGKHVLRQWFSYRRLDRERPIMGDRRPPSKLTQIQPDRWPAEYTSDLLDLLNVLGYLIDLEPAQADLLERICTGLTVSADDLTESAEEKAQARRSKPHADQHTLL